MTLDEIMKQVEEIESLKESLNLAQLIIDTEEEKK